MSERPRIRDLVPRRADGLPPGQREVSAFPRFSDKPLRWAPAPAPIALTLSVEGAGEHTLDADGLAAHERIEQVSDFHCVTTWTHRGLQWGGVRLRDVIAVDLDEAHGSRLPDHCVAHSADGQSAVFVTADLLGDDVLLATELYGAPLSRKHGGPLRLVSPGQYGYKNVKHLIGLDFRADEPASTLGPKEHLRARVAVEERHASMPNWALRLPYRISIIPTALAAERGLRKSPD